jgi:hypothetical protein
VKIVLVNGHFKKSGCVMRWSTEILCEPKRWFELAQGRFLCQVPLFSVFSLDVVGYCQTVSCNSRRFVVTLKL